MAPADLSEQVIDLHCAVGQAPGFDFRRPDALLLAMDESGVTHAVLGPIGRWAAVSHQEGEQVLAGWCARWPERFSRWVTVNPWYPDAPTRLRAALTPDVTGIKLCPAVQGFSLLQDSLVEPLLEVAERAAKPVYVVTGIPVPSEPFQLAELARRFPAITFVMGRSGRTDFSMDFLPSLCATENIVAETAYNGAGVITELAEAIGTHRLVFASDAPFNDLDLEVARVNRAQLSTEGRRAVFSGTAQRLLAGGHR